MNSISLTSFGSVYLEIVLFRQKYIKCRHYPKDCERHRKRKAIPIFMLVRKKGIKSINYNAV